ncbi:NADH:flavin oxidoreductase/NADH oxidase [Nonomuraea angiospora]|uniref:NADH:flavin oxidoreductase/NADH oxidase n=1 Tax=Nonomuraea angiospora TaxID=46172 RepID=UPI0029B20077|nr:NADH:flavin oxidoreductase/NADH oxidase [Nonomuraea angiospora]MDX3109594.1 NADH:flavin oxidoreductase/NADH oxidase [Nonomuraea angiospora]
MSALLSPLTLRELTLPNRVWLSPMCQYSAGPDGVPTDWHLVHLGARVTGGFGLVLTESTAVSPEGRISPRDTGLWSDEQVAGWRRITAFARAHGTPIGVQLGHAGRKASTFPPGLGSGSIPAADGGWTALGPSPLAYRGYATPAQASAADLGRVVADFAAATRRAAEAGFDVVEIHAGHGYLLHQFLSPRANRRTDRYGGSFDNRVRLLLEVVDAVRGAWPAGRPLLVRVSATDWVDGGWTPEETVDLARLLHEHGVDLLDVSTGGLDPDQRIPVGPGYQVPFARQVRDKAVLPVGAVGLITDPDQAETVLGEGSADVVLLGREALRDPSWPLRAAARLEPATLRDRYPRQYLRAV